MRETKEEEENNERRREVIHLVKSRTHVDKKDRLLPIKTNLKWTAMLMMKVSISQSEVLLVR